MMTELSVASVLLVKVTPTRRWRSGTALPRTRRTRKRSRLETPAVRLEGASASESMSDVLGGRTLWCVNSPEPVYETMAMGLENGHHGPQACFIIGASHPPVASGSDLVNFAWEELNPKRAGDTVWASARLVGTYDRTTDTMTLTEPPGPPVYDRPVPQRL